MTHKLSRSLITWSLCLDDSDFSIIWRGLLDTFPWFVDSPLHLLSAGHALPALLDFIGYSLRLNFPMQTASTNHGVVTSTCAVLNLIPDCAVHWESRRKSSGGMELATSELDPCPAKRATPRSRSRFARPYLILFGVHQNSSVIVPDMGLPTGLIRNSRPHEPGHHLQMNIQW
jgi:hypothetical protein